MSIRNKWYMQPEMLVGFSAIIVSLVAVGVSLYSASIDREFARASVWPRVIIYRSFNYSNDMQEGYFKYGVSNHGTGPALIKYAKVSYLDKPSQTWNRLIIDNNIHPKPSITQSHISTAVLPSNYTIEPLIASDIQQVKKLFEHDGNIAIELCYCSIYGECWLTDRHNVPEPIEVCEIDDAQAFRQ